MGVFLGKMVVSFEMGTLNNQPHILYTLYHVGIVWVYISTHLIKWVFIESPIPPLKKGLVVGGPPHHPTITKVSSTLTPNASVPPWSCRVWGRESTERSMVHWKVNRFHSEAKGFVEFGSFFLVGQWLRNILDDEKLQDVYTCRALFFLCNRYENSYFVVKSHVGRFLLK